MRTDRFCSCFLGSLCGGGGTGDGDEIGIAHGLVGDGAVGEGVEVLFYGLFLEEMAGFGGGHGVFQGLTGD